MPLRHKNHDVVQNAVAGIEAGAPRFLPAIALAELMFGALTDEASLGHLRPKIREVLRQANGYPIKEVTKHTRGEYAELRKEDARKPIAIHVDGEI